MEPVYLPLKKIYQERRCLKQAEIAENINCYLHLKPKNWSVKKKTRSLKMYFIYYEWSTKKILVNDRCDRAIVDFSSTRWHRFYISFKVHDFNIKTTKYKLIFYQKIIIIISFMYVLKTNYLRLIIQDKLSKTNLSVRQDGLYTCRKQPCHCWSMIRQRDGECWHHNLNCMDRIYLIVLYSLVQNKVLVLRYHVVLFMPVVRSGWTGLLCLSYDSSKNPDQ